MKIHTVPYIYMCIYIYETYKSVSYISYIHTKSAKNDRTVTLCLIHSVCPGKFRLQSVVTGVFRGFWSSSWNCRKEMEVMICSQPWTEGSSIAMALNLGKLLYVRSNCSAWNERWPSIYWDASPFSSYINVYIYIFIYHIISPYTNHDSWGDWSRPLSSLSHPTIFTPSSLAKSYKPVMQSVSTASSLGKSQVSTSDSNKWTSLFTIIWKSRDFLHKQICDENWFYIIKIYI